MSRIHAASGLAVVVLALAGCGSDDGSSDGFADRPAPPASDFPSASGRSLSAILHDGQPTQDLIVAPTSSVFTKGTNRYAFGVFTAAREEVPDAEVAIYAAPHEGGPAVGPFPARVESLQVDPRYESRTTAQDPDAAHVVYVSDVKLDRNGDWDVIALIRRGDSLAATLTPSIQVGAAPGIPQVGRAAPRIHTPTVQDVGGDLAKIDTRAPHDDMHDVDFADALGQQPVVLVFATPALCQSRVCGPVVDVAEQVKAEFANRGVDFIHMEVYAHNRPPKIRPQLRAFRLQTEPWVFVVGANGHIATRIEGAFGVSELTDAVSAVANG